MTSAVRFSVACAAVIGTSWAIAMALFPDATIRRGLGFSAGVAFVVQVVAFPIVRTMARRKNVMVGWGIGVMVRFVALFIFALRESSKTHLTVSIAFALFLGGGIGNLIDRLTNDGRVIDFMHIGIGSLRTGIFNVADMALMAGVFLLGLHSYRTRNTPPTNSESTS